MKKYDVIIAGAGPAGAACGYALAGRGVDALILEKKRLPRKKLCAGGVPGAVFKKFQVDCSTGGSIEIENYIFTFVGGLEKKGRLSKESIFSVDRGLFDMALVKKARERGADVMQGSPLAGAEIQDDIFRVETARGDVFYSRFLVGADGGFSKTARIFNLHNCKPRYGTCGYFQLKPGEYPLKYRNSVHLDLNFYNGGVAGILPKEDHLWVGVYAAGRINLNSLRKSALQFIEKLGLNGETGVFRGMFIPLYDRKKPVRKGSFILAGEAAGLVNPLSGEGIKPAVDSGFIAGEEIFNELSAGNSGGIDNYGKHIYDEIGRELEIADKFLKIAYLHPPLTYDGMVKVSDDAVRIMNGTLSYSEFYERLKRKIARKAGLGVFCR